MKGKNISVSKITPKIFFQKIKTIYIHREKIYFQERDIMGQKWNIIIEMTVLLEPFISVLI